MSRIRAIIKNNGLLLCFGPVVGDEGLVGFGSLVAG